MAAPQYPSQWGAPNAAQSEWWGRQSEDNKRMYGTMAGMGPQASSPSQAPSRPVTPKPSRFPIPSAPGQTKNQGTPLGSAPGLNYQTGYNANSQAINEGNVLGRLGKEGAGPASKFSGVNDLRKSQQMNDAAQVRRGVQQENAQQHMHDQSARSEIMQTAVSNMSKMYSDMAQRNIDQMGLAAQLQQAMIRNRSALFNALTQS